MKFKELQAKATPGEWYLGVGTQYCFHPGNRVAMCVGFEEAGEQSECTLAEFWPADHDKDIIDAQLMLHCRKHFAKVLQALEDMTGAMQIMWEALPDDATEEQEADFNGLNEAQQILKEAKEIK